MKDLSTTESKADRKDETVQAFISVLQCTSDEAIFYLDSALWDIQTAILFWLDSDRGYAHRNLGDRSSTSSMYNNYGSHSSKMMKQEKLYEEKTVEIAGLPTDWSAFVDSFTGGVYFLHCPSGHTQTAVPPGYADLTTPAESSSSHSNSQYNYEFKNDASENDLMYMENSRAIFSLNAIDHHAMLDLDPSADRLLVHRQRTWASTTEDASIRADCDSFKEDEQQDVDLHTYDDCEDSTVCNLHSSSTKNWRLSSPTFVPLPPAANDGMDQSLGHADDKSNTPNSITTAQAIYTNTNTISQHESQSSLYDASSVVPAAAAYGISSRSVGTTATAGGLDETDGTEDGIMGRSAHIGIVSSNSNSDEVVHDMEDDI